MQSPDYLRRLETILASRVEDKKTREHSPTRRLRQVGSVVAGTLACFFVLKGAALAHNDAAFAAPVGSEPGLAASLYRWVAGPDPVSSTLAAAMRPATAPVFAGSSTL